MYKNIIIYAQIYTLASLFPNLNKYLLLLDTQIYIFYLQLYNRENSIITRCCVPYLAVYIFAELLKRVLFYIIIYFKSNNINFANTDNIINRHYNNNINRI